MLQESKINYKERTAVLPGYSAARRDRETTRNDESRRDGGIGIVNHPGTRICPGGPEELPGVTRTLPGVRVNSG